MSTLFRRLGRRHVNVDVPPTIAGLIAWYRSDQGLTTGTGGVAAWADQSGNAQDLAQSEAGKRPAIQAAGVDFANTAGIRFTSANSDHLDRTQLATQDGALSSATLAVALTHRGSTNFGMAVAWRPSAIPSNQGIELRQDGTSGQYEFFCGSGAPANTSTLSVGDSVRLIGVLTSGSAVLYEDGTATGTAASVTCTIADNSNFSLGIRSDGTSFPADVSIAEVCVYNRALTASEISSLDDWLRRHDG